jgi:tight adherence protein B
MRRLTLAAALAAALASAASASAGIAIKRVETGEYPTLRATVVASSTVSAPPALAEDGQPLAGVHAQNLGRDKSLVVALDRSRSMAGRPLADAVAAVRAFVAAKPSADRIGLVTFGDVAEAQTGFSSATIDADQALRQVFVARRQGTALYDAVSIASQALAGQSSPGRVLVLVTDGRDQGSKTRLDQALAQAKQAGVVVYPIGIVSHDFDSSALQRLAKETGGTFYPAASTARLQSVYAAIAAELGRTWRLEYKTAARPGEHVDLTATVNGLGSATTSFRAPGDKDTSLGPAPSKLVPAHLYDSGVGTLAVAGVVALLVLVAAALGLAAKKGAWVRTRIDAHVVQTAKEGGGKTQAKAERFATASSLFLATEKAFSHLKPWGKIQRMLERADLPLRTVEFVYIMVGASFLLGLVAAVSGQASFVILLCFVGGFFLPYGFLWFKSKRRMSAFEDQLPDLLITLAASLKAGHSFRQGIQTVVDEGQAPASEEFKRVLTETRLGRPMDDALAEMAERVGSTNLDFVITSVTIQRQVGGSLAGLFDMVAEAVRQRQQFARKIKSLTAMGRMSAYTLIALPFFLGAALTLLNRTYMDPLYSTSAGHMLIGLGVAMMAIGSLALKKIVSFKG